MTGETKPKPAWSQSYYFPEGKVSFTEQGSDKPKTTGLLLYSLNPKGSTGFIFLLHNHRGP